MKDPNKHPSTRLALNTFEWVRVALEIKRIRSKDGRTFGETDRHPVSITAKCISKTTEKAKQKKSNWTNKKKFQVTQV